MLDFTRAVRVVETSQFQEVTDTTNKMLRHSPTGELTVHVVV